MACTSRPGLPWIVVATCILGLMIAQPGVARVYHRRLAQARQLAANTTHMMCAKEGPAASKTFMNATKTCLKLYSSGAPIRVPDDTKTTKWGQIFSNPGSPVFMDRNGTQYPISPKAHPPADDVTLMQIWPLLVVRAEMKNGTVTSFTVVLYVPYSTIMTTMINTQFEGQLFNAPPRPKGPSEYSWFRWTFGKKVITTNPANKYGTVLYGTFDNLFAPVKDSKGKCQPALCSDPARKSDVCKYYTQFFGNSSTEMTLSWDPNMHMPVDTELVPIFTATSRQYMAHFMELYNLFSPKYRFVPQNYSFIGHGTPMSTPQQFKGALTKATKVVTCKL